MTPNTQKIFRTHHGGKARVFTQPLQNKTPNNNKHSGATATAAHGDPRPHRPYPHPPPTTHCPSPRLRRRHQHSERLPSSRSPSASDRPSTAVSLLESVVAPEQQSRPLSAAVGSIGGALLVGGWGGVKFDAFAQSMSMLMPQEPEGGEEVKELMLVSASMILLISYALFSLQKIAERK